MTWLKKLGSILAKVGMVAGELAGLGPILTPLLGSGKAGQILQTGLNDFTQIGSMVLLVETALQGKPGTEKLTALIPLVGNIVKTSELVVGKKVADEAKFNLGIQEIAQGMVDLLNGLDQSGVPGSAPFVPPAPKQ